MKNLFDYATKELSQDAFLIWLFENADDDEIGEISKRLLASMVSLDSNYHASANDISDVKAQGQCEKMDIVVDFKLKGVQSVLIIEDKVVSREHDNQLMKYKAIVLDKWNRGDYEGRPSFFVYYKTRDIDEGEKAKVTGSGWKNFDFDKIKAFWEEFQDNSNLIVSQYARHVVNCWNDANNERLPSENNIDKWLGFFNKTLRKRISVDCDVWTGATYYGYAVFCVRPKGKIEEKIPYLEIRSRDCLNGKFEAKILMYGVDSAYLAPIRDQIRANESKGFFKGDYGSKRNKQVAHTFRDNPAFSKVTESSFISAADAAIKEYLSLVEAVL